MVALLAAHVLLAYTATLGACTTFDEPLHLVSGVAYWTLGDYRLQPENGNLPQRWAAIPLVFLNPTFPPLDQAPWRESEAVLLGRQYLYTLGNDPQVMLAAARAMATVWSTALCLVVFLWSRSIFGVSGGLVSLALAAFWPALVAHGPLATSDACGALFFTLGGWSLWRLFHRITPATLAAAFLAVGLAAIAKHSSVMLAPLAIVFLAAVVVPGRPLVVALGPWRRVVRGRLPRAAVSLAALLVPLAGAVFFIWASCGFRYAAAGPECGPLAFRRYGTLEACAEHAGGIGRLCRLLAAGRLLPEAWLYGMSYVGATVRIRNAFALGQYSITGWWWYFPLCLAIKNTLPALALALRGLAVACRGIGRGVRGRGPLDPPASGSLPLVLMLVVLWPTFLASRLNIGERHLLPSYPPLMILAGGTVAAARTPWGRRLVMLLVALHAADVAARWPHPLAYFNQIVPRGGGHRWLVDSNLDWGQDFLRLRRWLESGRRPDERVYLAYFGSCTDAGRTPGIELLGASPAPGRPQLLEPGLYCVSATLLQAVYDEPLGPWCARFEETYQRARAFVEQRGLADGGNAAAAEGTAAPAADADDAEVAAAAVHAFTILQSGRLRAFLRHRAPDASVGGSILVFRLERADLAAALRGPPAENLPQSWMERDSRGDAADLVRRAERLVDEGRLVAAEETLEQARRLDPGNVTAWSRLGLVYAARGRHAEAIAAHGRAARLAPAAAEHPYNLGSALVELGRAEEAVAAFDEAIRRDRSFRAAFFNRGVLRLRRGDVAAAREDLARFVALGGELPAELRGFVTASEKAPPP